MSARRGRFDVLRDAHTFAATHICLFDYHYIILITTKYIHRFTRQQARDARRFIRCARRIIMPMLQRHRLRYVAKDARFLMMP